MDLAPHKITVNCVVPGTIEQRGCPACRTGRRTACVPPIGRRGEPKRSPPWCACCAGRTRATSPARRSTSTAAGICLDLRGDAAAERLHRSGGRRRLPPELRKTKHHILDTIAAMVSGAPLLPGRKGIAYVKTLGGTKEACVIGSRILTSAAHAALANGMSAHADETDDSHAPSRTHPAAASCRRRSRWRNGWRRAAKRCSAPSRSATWRAAHHVAQRLRVPEDGHSTHSFGPMFGAAAAAGVLSVSTTRGALPPLVHRAAGRHLVLDARRGAHREGFDFGGMPARNGVYAATMVAQGFSGVEDVFSGERSFFLSLTGATPSPSPGARPGRGLRDPAHQYQALVGGLADPGAARSRCYPGRPEGRSGREARCAGGAPGREYHQQPQHAGYLHAAHVRGDAPRRHGYVQSSHERMRHPRVLERSASRSRG